MEIRLLQWNILFKEKIENILEVLQEIQPDIICLQELKLNDKWNNYVDTAAVVAESLGFHYHFAPAHVSQNGATIGNGIFSRYPLLKKESFFVQEPKAAEAKAWDEGRVVATADIDLQGVTLKVSTTHLSYTDRFRETKQKEKEVRKLVTYLQKQGSSFIFSGDLNVTPTSNTIRELSKFLKDCGPSYDEPTWTTKPFELYGFEETELRWRLDYVFATADITVNSARIVETKFSDHLPILVEFEVQQN